MVHTNMIMQKHVVCACKHTHLPPHDDPNGQRLLGFMVEGKLFEVLVTKSMLY